MMTFGTLLASLAALPVLSHEERALVRKYGTEEYLEWEDLHSWDDDFYSEPETYMMHPWYETKVRDSGVSKAVSTLTYMEGLGSRRAGSATSTYKRTARRAERRVGKEMIREQVWQ